MSPLTRTFWPDAQVLPVRRLVMAFIFAPLAVGLVVVLMAFLIAGMSEPTSAGVLRVTLNATAALVPMLFVFMLTFGVLGILVLWILSQRGILAWAVCGALMGALASLLMGEFLMGGVERPFLIASAIGGWTMLLLFRWIAGIRAGDAEEETPK